MKSLFVLYICAALSGGCTSGYVGARGGAVVVLAGGQETGPVVNSTNKIGSVYGVTVGGRFNEKVGLQADMTIRMASISQETRATFYQNGYYNFDGTVGTSATVMELPLLLTLSKSISERSRPILGIGAHLGFRTSTSSTINGVVTKLDGEGVGQTAPVSEKGSSSRFSDEPIIGFSALAGGDYKLSDDWSVRGELRFQHDFVNDYMGAYQIGSSGTSSAVMTAELPQTRVSIALSLLFAL